MASAALPTSRNIDIGRALTYVKDDPDVVRKLLIGSLVIIAGMFLVGIPVLFGYHQKTIRRAAAGEPHPLPEWDDWGGLFVEGLKVWAVMLLHVVVLMLPMMCCMGAVFGLLGAAQGAGDKAGGPLAALGVLGMIATYGFIFIVALGMMIYMPAVQVRLAVTGNVGEAFQVRRNAAFIRRNAANYALSILVLFIGNAVAQFAVLLLCVGVLPASIWAYAAFSFALGETVRRDPQFQATGAI